MKICLVCSENLRAILCELLNSRNIVIDDEAYIILIEKGYDLPDNKLIIIFDYSTLDSLIKLLDTISQKVENTIPVITGKHNNKYEIIHFDKILYFEGIGNYTYCVTESGQFKIKEKLYELEKNLGDNGFIRVGKPYIINILNVNEVIPWFDGRYILKFKDSEKQVEVARSYAKNFREFLGL